MHLGADTFTKALWTGVVLVLKVVLAISALTYLLIERPFVGYRRPYVLRPALPAAQA